MKKKTQYWLLIKTWDRRFVFGPCEDPARLNPEFAANAKAENWNGGGPVTFSLLREVKSFRTVGGICGSARVEKLK